MIDQQAAPLVPPEVDLRDFPYMPLFLARLRASDFTTYASGDEFRAGLFLWGAAWHERPAASLPDNDIALARFAELGRDLKTWRRLKAVALRGWVKCSDDRLYHRVVSELALEAWIEKLGQRKSSAAGNAKRYGQTFDPTLFDAAIEDAIKRLSALNPSSRLLGKHLSKSSRPDPDGSPEPLPSGAPDASRSTPIGSIGRSPELLPSPSQGKGRKEKEREEKKESSSSARAARAQTTPDDDEFLAEFTKAAKGNIAPGCANIRPIRKLLDEGFDWKLDILAFAEARISKGKPLQNFGNYWLVPEIRNWRKRRLDAAAKAGLGEDAAQRDEERFIEETAAEWPRAAELWRRLFRKTIGPPTTDRKGRRGWYFSIAMLAADIGAKQSEAAE